MSNNYYQCKRFNPVTKDFDYYFPMELEDGNSGWAKEYGYEVGWAKLGNRVFKAIFVPCKNRIINRYGLEELVETSSEVQHQIYLNYIKDELREQDRAKQNGRCVIPDGHGGTRICPCRVKNPDYIPGGSMPMTLPVQCQGCMYEPFKQEYTRFNISDLDRENEKGEMICYEVESPRNYHAADRYIELSAGFVGYVRERYPKLEPLAKLLVDELTKSEAARALGLPTSTVGSRVEKLKKLLIEFLDTAVDL